MLRDIPEIPEKIQEMSKKILILPGDYIGAEIMAEAVKVLEVLRAEGEAIEWSFGKLGGAAYDAEGHPYPPSTRSEEHTSELQSLMRISYAVFCLKKKKQQKPQTRIETALQHDNTES